MRRHVLTTLVAVLLAMMLAMQIGLSMPQIAMACVFIVMQPQPRLVLTKSLYRLLGTVAGGLATVALATLFSQTPARFLSAIGAWVSLCTSVATFSSQFRAYAIVLTGYTAVLVGIPALFEPEHMDTEALMRLVEVGLGILCAACVALFDRAVFGRHGPAGGAAPAAATAQPPMRAAVLAALYPASAMLATAPLWIGTSWPGGAMATLNATVNCALVALAPHPLRAAAQMSGGTLLAVAVGLAFQCLLPALAEGPGAYLALAPALALGAWLTARPARLGFGLGYSITVCMLAFPGGLAQAHRPTRLDDAAGIVLSIVVLMAVSAALQRLREARPCQSCHG